MTITTRVAAPMMSDHFLAVLGSWRFPATLLRSARDREDFSVDCGLHRVAGSRRGGKGRKNHCRVDEGEEGEGAVAAGGGGGGGGR